uniref:SCP domain-containing protein n=1 Tax=Glossina austeni TaxID=7395 RepID=A0A1A9VY32_GLOAU
MELFASKLLFLIFFLKINNSYGQDEEIDFCNKDLCPYQGPHVACGKNRTFSENCQDEVKLEDMRDYISLILSEHNYYRNQLAGGNVSNLDPAVRMPVLHWDWDLALTAEYNVRTCVFAHDKCRSTERFHFAGQNIYWSQTRQLNLDTDYFIKDAIHMWFEEYEDVDRNVLQAYRKKKKEIGHFTALVNDRQTVVGCAFVYYGLLGRTKVRNVIFTCNYPTNNIHNFPTYKPGPTASECKERNEEFTNLCDDPVDPNDFNWLTLDERNFRN